VDVKPFLRFPMESYLSAAYEPFPDQHPYKSLAQFLNLW